MFLYRRSLINISRKSHSTYLSFARFNSSSSVSDKENQVKLTQTDDDTTTVNNNNKKEESARLSFMPVINIPETELAHNAFFSLHRPLLGLSDKHERAFFSNRQEDETADDQLASYMMSVQAFVPPLAPGEQAPAEPKPEAVADSSSASNEVLYEDDLVSIQFTTEEEEPVYQTQTDMPVFHMPESADVVDYLTSIETKLNASNQRLANEELRLKKLEILNNNSSGKLYNRRSHVHNRLRRFQLRNGRK